MRIYCLTTVKRSAISGTVQETVAISAADTDGAVELVRSYIEAVAASDLCSVSLTDASGTVVWREGNKGGEDGTTESWDWDCPGSVDTDSAFA